MRLQIALLSFTLLVSLLVFTLQQEVDLDVDQRDDYGADGEMTEEELNQIMKEVGRRRFSPAVAISFIPLNV